MCMSGQRLDMRISTPGDGNGGKDGRERWEKSKRLLFDNHIDFLAQGRSKDDDRAIYDLILWELS